MKNIFTLVILTLFAVLSYSQTLVNQDWVQTGGSPTAMYDFHASHIDASHNLYVVGNTFHSGQQENFLIQKFNSSGVLQWEKEYNGTLSNTDFATDVTTVGSTIYVTGVEGDTSAHKTYITTIALNSSGTIIWTSKYIGTYSGYNIPARIIPNSSGSLLYVCGTSQTSATDFAMVTICYNSAGTQQWATRYDSTGLYSGGADLKIVGSSLTAYGVSGLSTSSGDFVTQTLNPSTGASTGVKRVNNPNSYITKPIGLVKDASENIYFTGVVETSPNNTDIKVVKLDSLLNLKWEKVIDGGYHGNDEVTGIKIDLSGDIVLTGFAAAADTSKSAWTIRMKDSVIVWNKKFYCPIQHKDAKAASIDLDSLANIYVTGKIYNRIGFNDLILAYDTFGSLKWNREYSLGSTYSNAGSNIIVDSGGYVYVNGISTTGSSNTYHTIQYSQWRAALCDSPSACPTITYTFGIDTITTSGIDSFLEFNIYAKQSVKGTSFYGGNIILTYSDSLFGINIVDSGKITLTRGTITTDTNYVLSAKDTIYKSGILSPNEREVRISIAPHLASGLYDIADTFQQLCHIKMKLKHIGNYEIQFDQFFMQNQSQYLKGDIYNYNFVNTYGNLGSAIPLTYLIGDVMDIGNMCVNDTFQFTVLAGSNNSYGPVYTAGLTVSYNQAVIRYINTIPASWINAVYATDGDRIYTFSANGNTPGSINIQVSPSTDTSVYDLSDVNVYSFPDASVASDPFVTINWVVLQSAVENISLSSAGNSNQYGAFSTVDSTISYPSYSPVTTTSTYSKNVCTTNGINNIESINSFYIHPNPSSGSFAFNFTIIEEGDISIDVQTVLGQKVYTKVLGPLAAGYYSFPISLPSSLAVGLYILKVSNKGTENTLKIIKE